MRVLLIFTAFIVLSTLVHAASNPVIWAGSDTAKVLTTSLVNKDGVAFLKSGDVSPGVTGPGSSTDNAVALFNGTGGGTLKNSVFTVGSVGTLTTSLSGSGVVNGLVFNNGGSVIPGIKWNSNGGSGIRFFSDSNLVGIFQDNGEFYANAFSTINGLKIFSNNSIRTGNSQGPGLDFAGTTTFGVAVNQNGGSNPYSEALFKVNGSMASNVDLLIQGAPSQTANLLEFRNSAGSLLSYVDAAGVFSGAGGSGANATLSNLGTTAINASLIPASSAVIDLGTSSKIYRNEYVQKVKRSTGDTIIDYENRELKDINGSSAFNFEDATNITIWKNLVPFSGSTNTVGASGNNMGHLWSTKIGRGTVEFTLPNAAGTAGQVLTNDGSAVASWGSGPITARAHASGTTISGTLATVVWTTEDFDNTNSLSSGVFTCPEAGKYQVNASLAISGTLVLNNTSVMEIQVNGTAWANVTHYIAGAITNDQLNINDIVSCAVSDTIRIQVSNRGTTPAIVSSNTKNWLSIARVGTL